MPLILNSSSYEDSNSFRAPLVALPSFVYKLENTLTSGWVHEAGNKKAPVVGIALRRQS